MVAEQAQLEKPAVSPDVFTDDEAAAFLRLPNARSFHRRRREAGITGVRCGKKRIYAREQLEAIRRHMFALSQ